MSLRVVPVLLIAAACSPMEAEDEFSEFTQQLRRATEEVPAFGGLQLDDGQVTIAVLGDSRQAAARAVVDSIFAPEASPAIAVRPERVTTQAAWQVRAPGVLSATVDGETRYTRVLVRSAADVVAFHEAAVAAGQDPSRFIVGIGRVTRAGFRHAGCD